MLRKTPRKSEHYQPSLLGHQGTLGAFPCQPMAVGLGVNHRRFLSVEGSGLGANLKVLCFSFSTSHLQLCSQT